MKDIDKPMSVGGAIATIIIFLIFIALFGLFGAIEQNMISVKAGAVAATVILTILALAAVIVNMVGND